MTASDEVGGGAEPEPQLPARPELSLPSNERFLLQRTEAKRNGTLADLQKLVAAWQAVAAKCDMAFEELTRLAIYRLEVERDLGAYLAQEVQHGGDRSRYARRTLLPDDITKNQSSAYQKPAAVPEDVFRAYLDAVREKHVLPSSRGARAFAKPNATPSSSAATRRDRRARSAGGVPVPPPVLDVVISLMTPDVVVGHVKLAAKKRIAIDSKRVLEQLRGDVFIAQCRAPECWLPSLERLRREARIRRAIIVLGADTGAAWFAEFERGEWTLCFVRDPDREGNGILLAHLGERGGAFRLACRDLGVVVRPETAD
ncbi:MAG: hypothetical protein JNL08_00955 [Planctomycetes bacterium]|nr:hypothetical protein [Planctomycetota bacterium]